MPITNLPTELQSHILDYVRLLTPIPSIANFANEPTPSLTTTSSTPLKNTSLVCKKWRALTLSWLFATSRIRLPLGQDTTVTSSGLGRFGALLNQVNTYLQVIASLGLQWHVKSLVLIFPGDFEGSLSGHSIEDAMHMWGGDGDEIPFSNVQDNIGGLWISIFGTLMSLRCLVIVAKPDFMARLVGVDAPMGDAWAFDMPLHYLRLSTVPPRDIELTSPFNPTRGQGSKNPNTCTVNKSSNCDGWILDVKNVKPWCHVGYNEGSYLPGYAVYEWQDKQPPNILREILISYTKCWILYNTIPYSTEGKRYQGRKVWDTRQTSQQGLETPQEEGENSTAQLLRPITITSMEHIALFPYALDIFDTWEPLFAPDSEPEFPFSPSKPHIPIHTLTIKYANTDHLADPSKIGKADANDVWHEWFNSWKYVVSRVLPGMPVGAILRIGDSGLAKGRHMVFQEDIGGLGMEFRRCWRMVGDAEGEDEMVWVKTEDEKVTAGEG